MKLRGCSIFNKDDRIMYSNYKQGWAPGTVEQVFYGDQGAGYALVWLDDEDKYLEVWLRDMRIANQIEKLLFF